MNACECTVRDMEVPALSDPRLGDRACEVLVHEKAGSLQEAAAMRGLPPSAVIKTIVVRRAAGEYVFVLVPGDRVIDWPKLRSLLEERRISLPDAEEALEATGYRRGTITPFGASYDWPVVADERITSGKVSIGGGAPGVSLTVRGESLVRSLAATVADITRPS